jgi:ligand-binding sensor domain-containing protein
MFLLAALGLLLGGPPEMSAPQRYIVERWSVDDGLPNNALTHLIQSRDGYLLIATWAGVVRFDGVRFTPIADDLSNAHARALLEDRDGWIWIGVSGTGLVRWHQGVIETLTEADGLAGRDVRALAADGEGRIWAATENGVSVIEPRPFDRARRTLATGATRITTYRMADGLPTNVINGLARGGDGWMWIATAKGVCALNSRGVRCEPLAFLRGRPNVVLEDGHGQLWVGTDTGLFSESFDPSPLAGRPVNALLRAARGGLWVGLRDGGVALVDDRGIEQYGAADGLPSRLVLALYEDREGSVWVATDNGGLARLKPKRVTMYSTADGLPSSVIGSVVQDASGTVWAATQCGPVAELRDGRFVPRFAEHTKRACARTLWPARDGSLWIGTHDDGLFRWRSGRMEHFDAGRGLSDADVTALFEDRDGVVWIGTALGGVHTYSNGRLSRGFGPDDGVATGQVASFAQDRAGRIWIGSNANGLSVYEGGRFRILAPDESPPTRNISALLVDSRGDLWVGSAAHGLFRRRNGRYEPFGVAQGLGDRLIAVVVEDRDANLWVGTARGISRLAREQIDAVAEGRAASLEPIILDRSDGLRNPEGSGGGLDPSGLLDRSGRIWMPTIDGVAVIDPASF